MRLILALLAALIALPALAEPPTGISLKTYVNGLPEGVKVGDGIRIADLGVNWPEGAEPVDVTFSLSGPDASSFELRNGTEAWFIAATPDYETKNSYSVTVTASTEGNEDVSAGFKLPVFDVKEATLAYRYDPDSKFLMGVEQVPTGKDGELLVGKNTTLVKPDAPQDGYVRVWNPETGAWDETELFVGDTVWSKETKQPLTIDYAKHGNAIPEGYTDVEPPAACEFCEWDEATSSWPENEAKKQAAADLIGRIRDLEEADETQAINSWLSNATPEDVRAYVTQEMSKVTDLQSAKQIIGLMLARLIMREASQVQKEDAE